jgi:hypothetical protein
MGEYIGCYYDVQLINKGFNALSVEERNGLVMDIAHSKNIPITDIDKDYLLAHHKELKIQHFSNICEEEILKGFTSQTNGNFYRTNRDDQLNFIGKYLVVIADESILQVFWKAENLGEQVPHTREEFMAIYKEGFSHKESKLYKLHVLRQQIRACKTDDEVFLINW